MQLVKLYKNIHKYTYYENYKLNTFCCYAWHCMPIFTEINYNCYCNYTFFSFHCHFQTSSILFSHGLENNKITLWNKLFIHAHNDSSQCWPFFYKIHLPYSTLCINCPVQISSFNTILETCKTIFMVDNIKMNEWKVYLCISSLLLGWMAPMIQMVLGLRLTQTWMSSCLDLLRLQTNNGSVGTLNLYCMCLFLIVVIYMVYLCVV